MANGFSLRIPRTCPDCGTTGSVTLNRTRAGATIPLSWRCTACNHGWVVNVEETERRRNSPERRKRPRRDRRAT
jgi:hypothetical protein